MEVDRICDGKERVQAKTILDFCFVGFISFVNIFELRGCKLLQFYLVQAIPIDATCRNIYKFRWNLVENRNKSSHLTVCYCEGQVPSIIRNLCSKFC